MVIITTHEILDFFKKNKKQEFTVNEISKKLKTNTTSKLLRLYQQDYLTREYKLINGYKRFVYKYKND